MSRISRDFHTANQNRHGFRFFGFILETFATIYSSVTGYILVNRFFHLSPLRDTSQSPAWAISPCLPAQRAWVRAGLAAPCSVALHCSRPKLPSTTTLPDSLHRQPPSNCQPPHLNSTVSLPASLHRQPPCLSIPAARVASPPSCTPTLAVRSPDVIPAQVLTQRGLQRPPDVVPDQASTLRCPLQENIIHSSILKLTNIRLYWSIWAGYRRIYGPSGLTLTGPIYSSVEPRHRWIYATYIRRWHGVTDEYMGRRTVITGPPIRQLTNEYRWDLKTAAFISASAHRLAAPPLVPPPAHF
jgi:hypothetical protein